MRRGVNPRSPRFTLEKENPRDGNILTDSRSRPYWKRTPNRYIVCEFPQECHRSSHTCVVVKIANYPFFHHSTRLQVLRAPPAPLSRPLHKVTRAAAQHGFLIFPCAASISLIFPCAASISLELEHVKRISRGTLSKRVRDFKYCLNGVTSNSVHQLRVLLCSSTGKTSSSPAQICQKRA